MPAYHGGQTCGNNLKVTSVKASYVRIPYVRVPRRSFVAINKSQCLCTARTLPRSVPHPLRMNAWTRSEQGGEQRGHDREQAAHGCSCRRDSAKEASDTPAPPPPHPPNLQQVTASRTCTCTHGPASTTSSAPPATRRPAGHPCRGHTYLVAH